MNKISIQIVTWNSLKFLSECLVSIFNQTYKDFSVFVIDNNSTDGTLEFLQKNYPSIKILRNPQNLGFAKAHNQSFKLSQSEFILVINPDIILEENFLEELLKTIEKDEKICSVGGKLMKIESKGEEVLRKIIKTNIIDSTGLEVFRSRKIIDRETGKENIKYQISKIKNNGEEVFGISGACVLYRREALEDVKIPLISNSYIRKSRLIGDLPKRQGFVIRNDYEYFDEDFFAYKEDVDLAFRLRIRKWKFFYNPKAIAYHYRYAKIDENREYRSKLVNYYSYKNHLLMLVKNEFLSNFLLDFPFILFYEFKKFFYLLFFETSTLKALIQFFKELPRALKKRKIIMENKKIRAGEMRKWFK